MTAWLRYQQEAFSRSLKRFGQTPLVTLVSILVMGVTLSLPLVLYLILINLHGVTGKVNAEPQISLYLKLEADKADKAAIDSIQQQLKANPAIQQFQFISKEQAFQEMQKSADLGEVLKALDNNPLPNAFVISGKSSDPSALETLKNELMQLPQIDHVQLDSAWAKRLATFNSAGEKIVLMLAIFLGAALLAVAGNTIRLQILTQRDEIEVGRLIGASDAYIRRPYLYFGSLQGVLGGLLALAIATAILFWLTKNLADLIHIYAPDFHPAIIPGSIGALVVLAAMALGWIGAYISVSLYLRQLSTAAK